MVETSCFFNRHRDINASRGNYENTYVEIKNTHTQNYNLWSKVLPQVGHHFVWSLHSAE